MRPLTFLEFAVYSPILVTSPLSLPIMSAISVLYQPIENELAQMGALAESVFSGIDPFVEEVIRYSFRLGGKRLRPAILFLIAKGFGSLSDNHLRVALAVELIHTATLIHDDILDDAKTRRHLETLNIRWDAKVGVLAGDWLLTKSLQLIADCRDTFALERMTTACQKTVEGELRQMGSAGQLDFSQESYFAMIAGKTAPLFACAAELGAYLAGAPALSVEQCRLFGHHLGLAFQIVDDILDLLGQTDIVGKTLQTDIVNRKLTLPLILYFQKASESDRNDFVKAFQNDSICENMISGLVERFRNSSALTASREVARQHVAEAMRHLTEGSERNFSADSVQSLSSLVQFVVQRVR